MNKLFLSALFLVGMVVAIVSCNQRDVDNLQPEVADTDLNQLFEDARNMLPASMSKYINDGQTYFEELQTPEYFANVNAKATLPVTGFRVVAGRLSGANLTWTNNFIYVLLGPVVVGAGDVLTIEEGTVIKALPGQTTRSSFLIVDRGGRVEATGTEELPIVFTSIADRVLPGEIYPETRPLPPGVRGLWGGVILLGQASNNNLATGGIRNIEGIQPGGAVPTEYGGNIDDDNSGTLNYVSIRHGGTEIGDGNEINGLTMGSVGSGTTIDFVEVISNRDDGFEWFGGTVNSKHLIAAVCGDDSFDYDQGFRGCGQFWFSYQQIVGDSGGEQDGGSGADECSEPLGVPTIANATYRGNGTTETMGFFDNAGGKYFRSIFTAHEEGVRIEDRDDLGDGCGSDDRFATGDILFVDNIFFQVNGDVREDLFRTIRDTDSSLTAATTNTIIGDPLFGTGQDSTGVVFELVPSSGITLFDTDLTTAAGEDFKEFFTNTNYGGAFEPAFQGAVSESWASRWTMWSFVFANPGGNLGPGTGTESPEE